jgi:3-oxoacyl-[acyl-carrier-protein] synthase II
MRRVVITGMGALTPLGNSINEFWKNLTAGKSGAGPITRFNTEAFKTRFGCEVKNFNPASYLERNEIKRSDLFTQFALVTAKQAWEDSGVNLDKENPYNVGVIWGTGQGGMLTFEQEVQEYANSHKTPRFSPFFIPKLLSNMASGMISLKFGLQGINYTAVSACATANSAFMDALNYIRWGKADIIISGGSEVGITEASLGGFSSMKALSRRNDNPRSASRPFDRDRDGFVMGEGSAALVLEEYEHAKARGAKIYAELAGAAMTADAYHLTATHPEGLGAAEGIRRALADAGLNHDQVDYINAHATSTPMGDISELKGIQHALKHHVANVAISATKSMTGHLLGAAGAIEAVAAIQAVGKGVVPPTINTENLDDKVPAGVDIVLGEAREMPVNVALSNTFGFGGHNAIAVFRKV